MKNKTITALIDADIVAFRASSASEERYVHVINKSNKKTKDFKHRTEFKDFLKNNNKLDTLENYEIIDKSNLEPESHCLHTVKQMIKSIQASTGCYTSELFLSSKTNFRDSLLLPKKYKGNRQDLYRPKYLDMCKEYILNTYKAKTISFYEADDLLSIRGYELLSQGCKSVLCTNDKDTLQANGLTMYDFTKKTEPFLIGDLGHIQCDKDKNKVSGSGMKFLAFQVLVGDSTDNYKSYELSKVKFGQVACYKLLEPLETLEQVAEVVLKQYEVLYPEPFDYVTWNNITVSQATWKDMLNLYFACAYMKRSITDEITGVEFYELLSKGIIYDAYK